MAVRNRAWLLLVLLAAACRPEAADKASLVGRGDAHIAAREYQAAVQSYSRAIALDPRDGAVRIKLAGAYENLGRWGDAALERVRAAELLPNDNDAQLLGLRGRLVRQEYSDALPQATALLEKHPRDPEVLMLFGLAISRTGDVNWLLGALEDRLLRRQPIEVEPQDVRPGLDYHADLRAEQAFRLALEIDPQRVDTRNALVGLLWSVGRLPAAVKELQIAVDLTPQDGFRNRILGLLCLATGATAEGERYLRAAAKAAPDPAAEWALAEELAKHKRWRDAAQVLEATASRPQVTTQVIVRLAEFELEQKNFAAAERWNARALAKEPSHGDALTVKAHLLANTVGGRAAVEAGRAAITAAPTSSGAHVALGLALETTGEREGAFDAMIEAFRLDPTVDLPLQELPRLALALNRNDRARDFAALRLERDPNDQETLLVLAQAQARLGDYSGAARSVRGLTDQEKPATLLVRGAIQVGLGNSEAGLALFQKAYTAAPSSFEAFAALTLHNAALNRHAAATRLADDGMARHPRDAKYFVIAARTAALLKDAAKAEARFREALKIDPRHTEAAVQLADLLAAGHRTGEAIGVLDASLAVQPALDTRMARARLFEATGRRREAIAQYEDILARDRDVPSAAARLAVLTVDEQLNLETALALAQDVRQRLPNDARGHDALGWVYLHKGLTDMALRELAEAVKLAPNDPSFRYHLGAAHQRTRNAGRAREQFTRALALSKNFPEAAATESALAALR